MDSIFKSFHAFFLDKIWMVNHRLFLYSSNIFELFEQCPRQLFLACVVVWNRQIWMFIISYHYPIEVNRLLCNSMWGFLIVFIFFWSKIILARSPYGYGNVGRIGWPPFNSIYFTYFVVVFNPISFSS